jgi:hypothetical protein
LKKEANFKLSQIKKLLFTPLCRKRFILDYFSDTEDLKLLPENCGMCDFCLDKKNGISREKAPRKESNKKKDSSKKE